MNPDKKPTLDELIAKAERGDLSMEEVDRILAEQEAADASALSTKEPAPASPSGLGPSSKNPPTDPSLIPTLTGAVHPDDPTRSTETKLGAEPKKYEIPKAELIKYLYEYSDSKTILDQGLFASKFNLPIPVAQSLVNLLVEKGVLNAKHFVDLTYLTKEEYSHDTTITITEAAPSPTPAPESEPVVEPSIKKIKFTSGKMIDFLMDKTKSVNPVLSTEDLKIEFGITEKQAEEEVLNEMKEEGIVDKDNKILPADMLAEATKDMDRDNVHEFDVATAEPVPSSAAPVSSAIPPVSAPSPSGASAGPLPPEASAGERAAGPEKAEALSRVEKAVNMMKGWYASKTKRYAIGILSAVAIGSAGYYAMNKNEPNKSVGNGKAVPEAKAPAEIAGSTSAPKLEASKKQETQPAGEVAGTTKAPEARTKAQEGQVVGLNPNYNMSNWWKQLDPEVKQNMENIIKAKDAKTYGMQFLNEIEVLRMTQTLTLSEKAKGEVYDRLSVLNNLLNLVVSNTNVEVPACIIPVQDEATREMKTCYPRKNLATMAAVYRKIGVILGESPYQPFSPGNITNNYDEVKAKVLAKANAEALK